MSNSNSCSICYVIKFTNIRFNCEKNHLKHVAFVVYCMSFLESWWAVLLCFSSQTVWLSVPSIICILSTGLYFSVFSVTTYMTPKASRTHHKPAFVIWFNVQPKCMCNKNGNAFCIKWRKEVSHARALSSACAEGCFVILLLHLKIKKKKNLPLLSTSSIRIWIMNYILWADLKPYRGCKQCRIQRGTFPLHSMN